MSPSYTLAFPAGSDSKECACNARDLSSIPAWIRRIPWRSEWLPTPVFLEWYPGESSWTEEPGGLQSMGSQSVGYDRVTKHAQQTYIWIQRALYGNCLEEHTLNYEDAPS